MRCSTGTHCTSAPALGRVPGARAACRAFWPQDRCTPNSHSAILLIKRGVKAIPRKSAEIVLDFDATNDPLHGSQEGAYFNLNVRSFLAARSGTGNFGVLNKVTRSLKSNSLEFTNCR